MSMGAGGAGRRTARQLLVQGWTEIPEILASSLLMVAGLGMTALGCYNYYKQDGDNRRYKATYVVLRPDDPRAALVHKD